MPNGSMDEPIERTHTTKQQELSGLITRGSIAKAIRLIAWPSMAMYLLLIPTWAVQMYFLSNFGKEYMAAATIGILVAWIGICLGGIIAVGSPTLLSQAVGRGRWDEAREIIAASIQHAMLIGVVCGVALFATRDLLIRALGVEQTVSELADFYIVVVATILPVFSLNHAFSSAFVGLGETMVALRSGMVVAVTSIIGSALLIPGISINILGLDMIIIPSLDLKGAATSMAAGRLAGMVYVGWWLRNTRICPSTSVLLQRFNIFWHRAIIRLGTPGAIEAIQQQVSSFVLLRILSHTSQPISATASFGVGDSVAALFFAPAMGYAMAAVPLMGQNVGAGKLKRARRSALILSGHTALIMSVLGVLLFAFSVPMTEHWAPIETDPDYHRYLLWYLRSTAVLGPFVGVLAVLMGVFRGAGDTITPACLAVASTWLARALQWFVCVRLGFDVVAAWWTWAVVLIVTSFGIILLFQRGAWLRAARGAMKSRNRSASV